MEEPNSALVIQIVTLIAEHICQGEPKAKKFSTQKVA